MYIELFYIKSTYKLRSYEEIKMMRGKNVFSNYVCVCKGEIDQIRTLAHDR